MIRPLQSLRRLHELETTIEHSGLSRTEVETLIGRLDARLLARYRSALQRHGDSALAEIVDQVCSGCYMRQPAQLRKLAEHICQCESCGRILYDPDAELDFLLKS